MTFALGMAWSHHSAKYRERFKQPIPKWLNKLEMVKRLRLIKVALALNWKLPDDILE